MGKTRYGVTSSDRKQKSNLNIYSPPPEAYNTFGSKEEAEKYAKRQSEKYNKVNINKIKIKRFI